MVIFVDGDVAFPLGLALFGVFFVAVATFIYLYGKWPERWVFPALGYIGAGMQAAAWVVVLVQGSVWWWNFLTITGFLEIAAAAVGVAFTIRHRQFISQRVADALLMVAGTCQLIAVCMWLFVYFTA